MEIVLDELLKREQFSLVIKIAYVFKFPVLPGQFVVLFPRSHHDDKCLEDVLARSTQEGRHSKGKRQKGEEEDIRFEVEIVDVELDEEVAVDQG